MCSFGNLACSADREFHEDSNAGWKRRAPKDPMDYHPLGQDSSLDWRYAVSGAGDTILRLWELESGRKVCTYKGVIFHDKWRPIFHGIWRTWGLGHRSRLVAAYERQALLLHNS